MWVAIIHILIYLGITIILVRPLGWYIAQVLEGKPCGLNKIFAPVERFIARCSGLNVQQEMDWKQYLIAMLFFNIVGIIFLYLLQRFQFFLPLNAQKFHGVDPILTFNTAASFVTNTNWQAYGGENTLSYLTQMLGITVQQFLSAGTGIALMAAFIRGLVRHEKNTLGNFWQDVIRSILYILLPLAILFSVVLISQGVMQNFKPYVEATVLDNTAEKTQTLPMGPVASLVAIKQLGTNGGGFFNTNAAHPFENPNLISNYLEFLAIIILPAALCYTFGVMINDRRQAWALLTTMIFIFVPLALISVRSELHGNPLLYSLPIEGIANMEGKEVRFGPIYSALWGSVTTATANGSVNFMHDSAMPLSGFAYMLLMQTGAIIFGGVGCGLYGLLLTVIIAVFVAGLMVGRTPEYLGKKIEPYEMKMISAVILALSLIVLLASAFASVTHWGTDALGNPDAQGLSEILYAFTSMKNNNGSAFAGLNANTAFYNIVGGLIMLMGRYWLAIGLLAVAGSLVRKKIIPVTSGTLETHTLTFVVFLIGVIIIICTLSFLPSLALGPIVEHLKLWNIK